VKGVWRSGKVGCSVGDVAVPYGCRQKLESGDGVAQVEYTLVLSLTSWANLNHANHGPWGPNHWRQTW
jgi:hypothetical protein